jgi:trimeric autotransporter adhesin
VKSKFVSNRPRSGDRIGSRRRLTAAFLALATLGSLVAVGEATETAGAAVPPRNGATQETAAPSCWSIKQNYASSPDGIYWLRTNTLVQPLQVYCDMTTDGGGWALVGRGRENWSFAYDGQQTPAEVRNTITGPGAFAPAALGTKEINGLMNGGRMDGLTDGLRVRRARNNTGTTWQDVRMYPTNYGQWSWGWGGGIYLNKICFDGTCSNISATGYGGQSTRQAGTTGDRRISTYPLQAHNWMSGFWYTGSTVTGAANNSTSYLWQYANEGQPMAFAQVFIRPRITEADVKTDPLPDAGAPAQTLRPMLSDRLVNLPWQVTNLDVGQTALRAYVLGFAEYGNTLFVGGKFREVQHGPGGEKVTQSYLAAFDRTTGEFIRSFKPAINAPVHELTVTPDGKLMVAGEFTTVNGVAKPAIVALDPTTGAVIPSWTGTVSRSSGVTYVRSMDIEGNWLYIGGSFTKTAGGGVNPTSNGNIARLRLSDGRPDTSWKPSFVDGNIWDIDATADRVYTVGTFRQLNGVNLPAPRQAIIDTVKGNLVPGLQPYRQNADTERQQAIMEIGDSVYQGGSQHFVHKYAKSDFSFQRGHLTLRGGDFQSLAATNGILYASNHGNNWDFSDTNTWSTPTNYTRVEPMNLLGAYDLNTLEFLPEFQPNWTFEGEGPWDQYVDSTGCLWAGGDMNQGFSSPFYGGFARFCPRDSQAPSVPANVRTSQAAGAFTITWDGSTDNVSGSGGIKYEILRDDPALGTVVTAAQSTRSYSVSDITEPTRFFVRAIDAEGNRSATTAAFTLVPPPPQLASLVSLGATWSYRADGIEQGAGWRNPGTDVSSWATGAAELGWGDGDEATVIPGTATTQYFVRDFDVTDPAQYGSLKIRLLKDDGAVVYVNGLEVARSGMPAGPVNASTLATDFVSGTAETTFNEYVIPASLLTGGTNRIAVELHQAQANNADGSFNLEVQGFASAETSAPSAPVVSQTNRTANSVALSWTPSTDDRGVAGYFVRRDGTDIAFTSGTSWAESGLAPTQSYAYEVRAVDTSGNVSTPGAVSVPVFAVSDPTLVAAGSAWKYLDDGSNQNTAWRNAGFDDSTWKSGPSLLGYGKGDEATVVGYGPNATQRYLTTYFRRTFNVDSAAAVTGLELRLVRDDGAVVYVNGVEVARSNMPAGTITNQTFASTNVGSPADRTWNVFQIPPSALVDGTNTIAVEVHQNFRSSTDLGMNLALIAAF